MPILPTADLVGQMLAKIVDTADTDRSFVPFRGDGNDEVVLLVNNLGSISELELGGIAHEGELITAWLAPDSRSYVLAAAQGVPREAGTGGDVHDLVEHARLLPHLAASSGHRRQAGIH